LGFLLSSIPILFPDAQNVSFADFIRPVGMDDIEYDYWRESYRTE